LEAQLSFARYTLQPGFKPEGLATRAVGGLNQLEPAVRRDRTHEVLKELIGKQRTAHRVRDQNR
jgi:hypothetical protein